jgi:hypothetical protein
VLVYVKRRKTERAVVCLYGWNVPVAYSLPCTLSVLRCLGARISLSPCLHREGRWIGDEMGEREGGREGGGHIPML